MIASVSTFSRSSGATRPVCTVNLSMTLCLLTQFANIDEMPFDCGRGSHRGAHEMRASARALTAFEVAVRRRRAALARFQTVRIHGEAHRAARLAPFEARIGEHLVETFAFRLRLHEARARDDHRETDIRRDAAAELFHDPRSGAQVFDARIRA